MVCVSALRLGVGLGTETGLEGLRQTTGKSDMFKMPTVTVLACKS